jgi:hypothetical protein
MIPLHASEIFCIHFKASIMIDRTHFSIGSYRFQDIMMMLVICSVLCTHLSDFEHYLTAHVKQSYCRIKVSVTKAVYSCQLSAAEVKSMRSRDGMQLMRTGCQHFTNMFAGPGLRCQSLRSAVIEHLFCQLDSPLRRGLCAPNTFPFNFCSTPFSASSAILEV